MLSVAEEKKFVSNWQAKAEAGQLVVLSTMRADLAKQLGRKVAPEVFYRWSGAIGGAKWLQTLGIPRAILS